MMDREHMNLRGADNPIDDPVGRPNDLSDGWVRELWHGAT